MHLMRHFAEHLEFCGFGVLAGPEAAGNIFYGRLPDQPDLAMAVFSADSGSGDSGARMLVTVRGGTVNQAYEQSQAIAEALHDFDGFLHGDGPAVKIKALETSKGLGPDAKNRELFQSGFRVKYCEHE